MSPSGRACAGPVGSCGLQATISLIVARMSLSASATRYGDIRVPAFPPDPACRHRAALARARWLMRATSYNLSHRSPDERSDIRGLASRANPHIADAHAGYFIG